MASDISVDQWFSETLEEVRQDVLELDVCANWRAEVNADIRLNEKFKESLIGIDLKNLAISTFEEIVDIYSREHLCAIFTQIVLLNADEHKRQAIIEGVAQATVSDLREIKQKEKKEKQ